MKTKIIIAILLSLANLVVVSQSFNFQTEKLRTHIEFLASDSLKGRFPGTPEDKVAAQYIRDAFASYGLELLYEDGFQPFEVLTSVKPSSENTSLSYGSVSADFGADFGLYAFSSSASLDAEVVFAKFGMVVSTDELQHNDYENIDAKGKWVVVLKGDPEPGSNSSPFIPYGDARSKAMFARDQGAIGIILVGGAKNIPDDDPAPFVVERSITDVGLPVIDLRKDWADKHLFSSKLPTDSLESWIINQRTFPWPEFHGQLYATTELVHNRVSTYNIAAQIKGNDPLLKNEYIVIGAHYDHLGMGGPGSGSRMPDTTVIHYGADDNASGVTGVIEMAGYYASKSAEVSRSLLFVAFGAEEMGLLGSRYFVDNPPVSIEKMTAMINFDMIGRLSENKSVSVSGTGSAVETEDMLSRLAENSDLTLSFSPQGFGPSDHASFYAKDIPVMFFTTGAHPDYHTDRDTPDKINYDGMAEVLSFASKVTNELNELPVKLSFQEAGPRERQRSGRGFRVTLGIMPDFTASGGGGLPVGGVTKDGPADGAGMQRGDIIVAINGLTVDTIYDYMNRLNQLKRGESANVDVVRNGERIILIVDL